MKKTSLLLTNYPSVRQNASFEEISSGEKLDIVTGYDIYDRIDKKLITRQIANDIILGLLCYDEILLEASHVWDVIQVWGSEYLKELLRLQIVRVVNDTTLNPVMLKGDGKDWHVDLFSYSESLHCIETNKFICFNHGQWNQIANTFFHHNFKGIEAETILILIDEGACKIDETLVKGIATKETNSDLQSQKYFDQFKIEEGKLWARATFERQIRLMELNKTCAIASILNVDSIRCDAQINELLSHKSDSIVSKKFPDGTLALKKILFEKKFPELGSLFVQKIITLDDLLKLRNNFNGRLFRYWLNNSEYDEVEMRADIMNTTHNVLGTKTSQAIRLMACNLIGICGFIPGISASAFDSYILNKISSGWHPNFFLDNNVKKIIDDSIRKQELEEKTMKLKQAFYGVGRNNMCPCGSGLKFKKCHGKGL